MIDYNKINQQIQQKKWEKITQRSADTFTCYYDPHNRHDLCPHPEHCILNKEFQEIHAKITRAKMKIKQLDEIYNEVIELIEEFPNTPVQEFYAGFNARQNRIERRVLQNEIKEYYKQLRDLKTRKGGY